MTTSKWKSLEELHETDADGRFTQRITGGATTCQVAIYHPGYLPMRFEFRSGEGERHIQLVPVPQFTAGEQDFIYDIVYPDKQRRSYTVGPLLEKRGVGLVIGGPADRYAGTWTTNREEADVWIEVVDQHLEEKVREEISPQGLGRNKEWGFEILGLRGTEIFPIYGPPLEGMMQSLRFMEAPEGGYSTHVRGMAKTYPEKWSAEERVVKPTLPSSFFVRKAGRYGRVESLGFEVRTVIVGEAYWDREIGDWVGDQVVVWSIQGAIIMMQRQSLGHPFLLPRSALEKVPHWAE